MRLFLHRLLLLALASTIASAASAHPVRLVFAVEPANQLAGLPVTFRITAWNTGATPAKLPVYVLLQLISDTDEPETLFFTRPPAFPVETAEGDLPPFVELAPGEQKRLDYIGFPPWLSHPRLSEPGTYRLRLITAEGLDSDGSGDFSDPIISNEATFTVRMPTGADAEAYALFRSNSDGELWSRYPDSIYTSMTVRPYPPKDRVAELESLKAALAKNPPEPVADKYRYSIAVSHRMFMDGALTDEGNIQKAFEHSDAARVLLEQLINKETEFHLKNYAKKEMEHVRTFDELKEWHERRSGFLQPCARNVIEAWRGEVAAFLAGPRPPEAKKKIEALLPHIDAFIVEAAKTPADMVAALTILEKAGGDLEEAIRKHFLDEATSRKWSERLGTAALLPVVKGIEAAENDSSVDAKKLDAARADLERARALFNAGELKQFVAKCREALHKAWSSSSARGGTC